MTDVTWEYCPTHGATTLAEGAPKLACGCEAWCERCGRHRVEKPGAVCPVCKDIGVKGHEEARRELGWV